MVKELTYCARCLMPDSRPGISFDENGICHACLWHDKKKEIDWDERNKQFHKIADWARAKTESPWDCVLGVSGGKDSLWQAFKIRDEYGLNPLLVMYVGSDNTELGRENAENIVNCGFTVTTIQPNPQIAGKLARKSFLEYGNIAKFSESALYTAPFRAAIDYNVPLVLFGENAALERGDKESQHSGWDASAIRFSNTMGGGSTDIWLDDKLGIEKKDLIAYNFPSPKELDKWGGRGVYMGFFMNWSAYINGVFSLQNGLKPRQMDYEEFGGPFKHNSLDADCTTLVNYLLKYMKFGFAETTEHLSPEIRRGLLTRKEAAALVTRLDGKCDVRFIEQFCEWADISKETFYKVAETYRGDMWEKQGKDWVIRNHISRQYNDLHLIDTDAVLNRIDTIKAAKNA